MKAPDAIILDFETEGIQARPQYPPKPVGFAMQWPGEKAPKYHAWGHPCENNCTKEQAQRRLREAWNSNLPIVGQHMKFDTDVAQTHMGVGSIDPLRVHDTEYLLFLHDPHARSLSLKPSAERILGIKPKERDKLREWVIANVPEAKRKPAQWGTYICRAPGGLVGRYAAHGDVRSTRLLFNHLHPKIMGAGMGAAYDRERLLMPILLENERQGVRVDLPRLERDVKMFQAALEKADNWLRKRLGKFCLCGPEKCDDHDGKCNRCGHKVLNINADQQFADALEDSGVVTEFVYTKPTKSHPEGQRSVSKKNLTIDMFNDAKVASVYGYRNRLQICLDTFMLPWLEVARETGGWVHTNWNQVRQNHDEKHQAGARTGRLSSNPNFQNLVKNWKKAFAEGYKHPKFLNVPELPLMRQYWLPDKSSHLWGRRDQNQQELRILAHFEDGEMLQRYIDDPRTDIHAAVQQFILEIVGLDLPRDPVKILNFGDIYGRGLGALAEAMGVDVITAKRLRRAKDQLLPGVPALVKEIKERAKQKLPITTWGGRQYYCEDPKFVAKFDRVISFEYKLLNYLVQGSGADITKEIAIRYYHHPRRVGRLLLTVHDEFDISAPRSAMKQEMQLLGEIINGIELDCLMLSDGETGNTWGNLEAFKYDKPLKAMAARA